MALRAADATFGSTVNAKGYKVVKCAGVIQGDGINIYMLAQVLEAVLEAGYSAEVCVCCEGTALGKTCVYADTPHVPNPS